MAFILHLIYVLVPHCSCASPPSLSGHPIVQVQEPIEKVDSRFFFFLICLQLYSYAEIQHCCALPPLLSQSQFSSHHQSSSSNLLLAPMIPAHKLGPSSWERAEMAPSVQFCRGQAHSLLQDLHRNTVVHTYKIHTMK